MPEPLSEEKLADYERRAKVANLLIVDPADAISLLAEVRLARAMVARIGKVLADNGCDCDNDDDPEPCLGHRIEAAMREPPPESRP